MHAPFRHAAIALAASLGLGAQASTTDWGVHDALELATSITPVGSFSDSYLFSVPSALSLFSAVVTNNLDGILTITGGDVTLFKETGAVDSAIGSFSFNGTTGSTTHDFGALPGAGDYYYVVSGLSSGSQGGFYVISSTVSAVPEPETYAMLLAGLGALGFMARRRPLS